MMSLVVASGPLAPRADGSLARVTHVLESEASQVLNRDDSSHIWHARSQ
jgi:hypothetical protein